MPIRDLHVCASMRGMEGVRLTQGLDPCCSYDNHTRFGFDCQVPPIGLEPISLSTEVFETSVFTNFTTGAY